MMQIQPTSSDFQIQKYGPEEISLKDSRIGEAMHSSIGAWTEAQVVYIQQSKLSHRLSDSSQVGTPLVIYDIGLGIAANALAAIQVFQELPSRRDLHLISFETDLSALSFALEAEDSFFFLSRQKDLIQQMLKNHRVEKIISTLPEMKLTWELKIGDFRNSIDSGLPSPELIYFDLYSPKICPELWNRESFALLFAATEFRRKQGLPSELFTYSSATATQKALSEAGFWVSKGESTSRKRETTIASSLSPMDGVLAGENSCSS